MPLTSGFWNLERRGKMIYTSRYSNPELKSGNYTAVRISLGSPRWSVGYIINGAINELMPKGLFGKYDNDKPAFEREYRKILDKYGISLISKKLKEYEALGKDVVLLCYEDIRKGESDWCHRTMFAKWWNEKTGEVIEELFDPTAPKVDKPKKAGKAEKTAEQETQEDLQLSLF